MITENIHIEASYSVKDDRFTIEQVPESELIVELSDSFLRFGVSDPHNRIMWLEDFPLYPQSKVRRVKQLFDDHPLLSIRFWKRVKILVHSFKKCFIPSQLDSDEAKEVLKFLYKTEAPETYITKAGHGTFAFEIEPELIDFFEDFYLDKKPEIILADSVLNENMLIFHQSGLSLFIAQKATNTYFASSHEKIIPLLKETDFQSLVVCGEVTAYAMEFKQLSARFSEIKLAEKIPELAFSQYFQECPMHRYYLLFAAALYK